MADKSNTKPAAAPQLKIILSRPRRVRGRDILRGTVLGSATPERGFTCDDLRKALQAGHAKLVVK